MTFRRSAGAAIGVGSIVAALTLTGTGSAVAQGVLRPVQAFIVNTSADPVPVSVGSPLQVLPPPWQGTPFIKTGVVLNSHPLGHQVCEETFVAEAGTAVTLSTVTGDFNVKPGSFGFALVKLTLPDGTTSSLILPTHRSGGASQASGIYDRYAGSLNFPGLPVVKATACVGGLESGMDIAFVGFSVALPVIQ